jgi:hypothetical protein
MCLSSNGHARILSVIRHALQRALAEALPVAFVLAPLVVSTCTPGNALRGSGPDAAIARAAAPAPPDPLARASTLIDAALLLEDLRRLASDEMEGRRTGTPGAARARAFIAERFAASGVQPFGDSLLRPFRYTAGRRSSASGTNVVGYVSGTREPALYIVLTAHYDHLGVRGGEIFNGANDNASGAAALIALGAFFSRHPPAHSLIFAALDAEESGLRGAEAFLGDPPVPAPAIALNLNLDMIGRDPDDRLFVAGTRQQPFLARYVDDVAARAPVTLLRGHDDPAGGRDDWTDESDHYAFCRAGIPCLYVGVEDYDYHHVPEDDFETMTHDFYVRAVETVLGLVQAFDGNLDAVAAGRLTAR